MKIKPEHYIHIVNAIRPLKPRFAGHREYLKAEARCNDLEMRFRWDAAHAAKLTEFFCDSIYPYANDEHIDTALRAAIAEIEQSVD